MGLNPEGSGRLRGLTHMRGQGASRFPPRGVRDLAVKRAPPARGHRRIGPPYISPREDTPQIRPQGALRTARFRHDGAHFAAAAAVHREAVRGARGKGTPVERHFRVSGAVAAADHRPLSSDGGARRDFVCVQQAGIGKRDHRDEGERCESSKRSHPGDVGGGVRHAVHGRVQRSDPSPREPQAADAAGRHRAEEADLRTSRAGDQRGQPGKAVSPRGPPVSDQQRHA